MNVSLDGSTITYIAAFVACSKGIFYVFFFLHCYSFFLSVIVNEKEINQFEEDKFCIYRPIIGRPELFGQRVSFCSKICLNKFQINEY